MKKTVSAGLAGLTALGIAGNFLISLPLSSDDGSDILGAGLAVIFSFITLFFLYPLLTKLFSKDTDHISKSKKALLSAVYILTEAVLIYIAVTTLTEFSRFASSVMLPNVRTAVIFVIFAIAAVIISRRETALSKLAAVLLFITSALIVMIFLFSISKMSLKYIVPAELTDIGASLKTALSVYCKSFATVLVPIAVVGSSAKGIKSVMIGNAVGAGIVLLCMLNTVLVFGGGFASTLDYPYSLAVSTANMGDIFSGMDGFLYVTVIFTCIIKTALVFYAVKALAYKISNIKNF